MATREEVLRYVYQVTGNDDLTAAAKSLLDLGDASDETQAAVKRLADEFAAASSASKAVDNYKALAASQGELADAADKAGLKLKLASEQETNAAAALRQTSDALDAAKKAQADYATQTDRTAEREQELGAAVKAAATQQRAAQQAWKDANRDLQTASTGYNAAVDSQQRLQRQLSDLDGELAKAGVSSRDLAGAQDVLSARAAAAQASMQRLQSALAQERSAADTAAAAAQRIADAHKLLGTRPFGDLEAEIQRVRDAYNTLAESGELSAKALVQADVRMQEKIRDLQGQTNGWATSLLNVKAQAAIAGAGIIALARQLGSAAKGAIEFEQAMASVSTLLDNTSGIPAITEQVRELAAEFGGDATANAKALYSILSAGVSDVTDAMSVLRTANELALGGITSVDTAAKGVTATLNAYRLNVGRAGDVSDAFFTAAKSGATDIDQLAQSIGRVAPVASAVGVGFDQLFAAIATLTNAGLSTDEAVTQIRSALASVISPSQDAKNAAKELGVEFSAAALKSKGLSGFLADIATKAGGNQEALSRLFGNVNALQAVLSLGGTQAKAYADALADMGNRAGATQEAVGKMASTGGQDVAKFHAAVDQVSDAFGNAVLALTPLLNGVSALLNVFNLLPPGLRTALAGLTANAAAVVAIGAAGKAISGPLRLLIADLKAAATGMAVLGDGATKATSRMDAFRQAQSRIPKSIKVVMAVEGIAFAIQSFIDLAQAVEDYRDALAQAEAIEKDWSQTQRDLADKAAKLAQSLRDYAGVQIESAVAVEKLSQAEAKRYKDSLVNAERYYQALVINARNAGDATAEAFAAQKLKAYQQALSDLAPAFDKVTAAAAKADKAAGFNGAAALLDKLKDLQKDGTSAADALDKVFKDRKFGDINEPAVLGRALGELSFQSKETAATFAEQLIPALAKLDGQTLAAFQQNAVKALSDGKINAVDLSQILDVTLQAALSKLGVSAAAAGASITSAGADMIATFKAVASNAQASAQQVGVAFEAALTKARTAAEAEQLGKALEQAFAAGKISAQQYADGLREIHDRVDTLNAGADQLSQRFAQAGIKTQAALDAAAKSAKTLFDETIEGAQKGAKAQEDVIRTFQAYAAAARAAVADSSAAAKEQVEQQLRAMAAANGLSDALLQVGSAGKLAGQQVADAANKAADALHDQAEAAGKAKGETQDLYGAAAVLAGVYQGWRDEFKKTSDAAVEMYDRIIEAGRGGRYVLEQVGADAAFDTTGITAYLTALNAAVAQTQAAVQSQRDAMAAMVRQLADVGTSAQANFGTFAASADLGAQNLDRLIADLKAGKSQFDLLGQADLDPLLQALEAARQRTQALQDQAAQAKQQLEDLNATLQDQIDEAKGNQEDIENRRYQKQLDDAKQLAEQQGNLNSREYQDAVRRINELHKLNLDKIRDEANAQKQADADVANARSRSKPSNSSGSNASSGADSAGNYVGTRSLPGININLYSTVTDPRTLDVFARQIKTKLDQIARRSR
jgi:TP901 family phage tail tape measure protein